ncbi:Sec-independent protein translocase subunit TatA [Streptomyces sp. NPDC056411]|uniref:Sec-independent protein translocase subunit TatA n=1 Tax=Streptomyces sp. NPDC056411 TaxID=3345813 RepID=UPI0035DB1189
MLRNGLEPWHLLIVGLVVLLLFGSKKLPDTARALGKSLRILKSEARAMKGDDSPPATGYTARPTAQPEPSPAASAPTAPAPTAPVPSHPESDPGTTR